MPQDPIQPDPVVTEFTKLVAMKAVIDTFSDLLECCIQAQAGTGVMVCVICGCHDFCDPGCARERSHRALNFLLGRVEN